MGASPIAPVGRKSLEIKELIQEAAKTAELKGWKEKTLPEAIALMHSELSEALEHYRNGHRIDRVWLEGEKPDGVLVELADTVIRIFDFVGNRGLADEFVSAMQQKMNYNKDRPMRHGGKLL